MTDAAEVLARVLSAPRGAPIDDAHGWRARHLDAAAGVTGSVARAIAGGAACDRAGGAFASGYVEALRKMVPAVGDRAVALAATEAGGAHPRAIATRLERHGDDLLLDGEKRFVTLAGACDAAIVIASEGEREGKNRLAAVLVPLDRAGVACAPVPPTPFAPEVPHSVVTFRAVVVTPDERLPGDGYDDYLKPFRTVEDIHVMAALTAWVATVWRATGRAASDHVEELAALALAFVELGELGPGAATTHRALAGALAAVDRALARGEALWQSADTDTQERWRRDRAILSVAGKVRALRLARARGE